MLLKLVQNKKYFFLFALSFMVSLTLNAQTNSFIYDKDVYLNPKDDETTIPQVRPRTTPYYFDMGPRLGLIAGGMYFDGISPYFGILFEMPFNRFVGFQINATYHQYNITFEEFRWVKPNFDSAVTFPSAARNGIAILNYFESQIYFKFYIEKFWLGVGAGINVFINGKIKRIYRDTANGEDLGNSYINDIKLVSEPAKSETSLYLHFSIGRVSQVSSKIFLFPEVYSHFYVFTKTFLNQEWFVLGVNLGVGYKF